MACLTVTLLMMAGFLAMATLLQFNDPHPFIWTAVYGLPLVLTVWACVANVGNMLWRSLCGVVLLVTIWFASTVLYSSMQEGKLGWDILCSEEGRESAGLVVVVIWLLLLLLFNSPGLNFNMAGISCSRVGMLMMVGFLSLATVLQAVYGLPLVLTVWACTTNAGVMLWRCLCIVVLSGITLFAKRVLYSSMQTAKLDWDILCSEEERESAGLVIVVIWLLLLLLFNSSGLMFNVAAISYPGVGMLLMTGFLALAAMAQFNDPDPFVWTAVYGLPLVLTVWACAANAGNMLWRFLCGIVLLGIILFAGKVMYSSMQAGKLDWYILSSEEGRESAGLVIVVIWLLLLLLFNRGRYWEHGLLAFALVPVSAWIALRYYQSLPNHCGGLI